jgi:hypothetical protein
MSCTRTNGEEYTGAAQRKRFLFGNETWVIRPRGSLRFTAVVSKDGKTMTVTFKRIDVQGKPVSGVASTKNNSAFSLT